MTIFRINLLLPDPSRWTVPLTEQACTHLKGHHALVKSEQTNSRTPHRTDVDLRRKDPMVTGTFA